MRLWVLISKALCLVIIIPTAGWAVRGVWGLERGTVQLWRTPVILGIVLLALVLVALVILFGLDGRVVQSAGRSPHRIPDGEHASPPPRC